MLTTNYTLMIFVMEKVLLEHWKSRTNVIMMEMVLQKTKAIATIMIQVFIQEQQKFVTMALTRTVTDLIARTHHHQEMIVLVLKFLIILNPTPTVNESIQQMKVVTGPIGLWWYLCFTFFFCSR